MAMSAPVDADAAMPPATTTGATPRRDTDLGIACGSVTPKANDARSPTQVPVETLAPAEHRADLSRMMPGSAPRQSILIIEDNSRLVAMLDRALREQGYGVRSARDGDAGLVSALDNEPDLVILDVGLPRRNGFNVVRELRRGGIRTPTLMLTARREVADRVTGLEAGADDYLVKPFDVDELVARVRALLRRAATPERSPILGVGDLVLDPVARTARRGDRQLALTRREFALLECFMRHPGEALGRNAIARYVWHEIVDGGDSNIVDVYVAYLRRKLDAEEETPMLHTLRGVGYMLRAPSED
jgi:two-component system, OmpR family, response regulator MprA